MRKVISSISHASELKTLHYHKVPGYLGMWLHMTHPDNSLTPGTKRILY